MNKPDISERNFEQSVELGLLGDPDLPLTTTSYYHKLATAGTDGYSRELCLHLTSLFDFVTTTQPQTWAKLVKQYGGNDKLAREQFSLRLATEISKRGSLDVLRKGVSDHGCKFELAYFRPETSLNPTHQQHYNANILGVARQLHFSTRRPNDSIDIVLFLNGLPLITIELKNPLTGQTYLDAISQYRERDASELIFQNGRCLAHFAVDPDQAWMATQLRGSRTIFRPFNRGTEHGAGNPPNPTGFRTAYLWEQVWQRDSMLDLVNKFVQFVEEEDEQGHKTGSRELVFPRYHQLTAVRNMVAHTSKEGAGRTYLVQHSAGSGKTKTIAWLAHHLASLHDARDQRVFNSVVVVSDRRILDHQLQRAVRSFAQVVGLVEAIDEDSSQLREALEKGKGIIVTTMQKFPIVLKNITELAGERFAVIMDEAHSSQQGGAARSLKDVLSVGGLAEAEQVDGSGEIKLLGKDGQLHAPADRTEQTLAARDRAPLSRILEYVNEHYGTDFTDEDKLNSFTDDMRRRMESNRNLVNAMNVAVNPRVEDRLLAFRGFFSRTLEAMIEANFNIYQKITDDAALREMIRQMLFNQLADRLTTQTSPLELSINCWDMPTHSIGASELEIATQQRRLNVKPGHPLPCLTLNPQPPPPPSRAAPLSPRLRRCYCPYCAGSRTPLLLL